MSRGFFITGTDTGVGKTVVSAILCVGLNGSYWKPIQTGTKDSSDSNFIQKWICRSRIFREVYALSEPLSPHAAAAIAGTDISLDKITASVPQTNAPLIVEGAGGVMVPINKRHFIVDVIKAIGLPGIVVSRSTLGTINHTLLTLDCLRRRDIPIKGVVIVGERNDINRAAIERFGEVEVISEVFPCDDFSLKWLGSQFEKFNLGFAERDGRNAEI